MTPRDLFTLLLLAAIWGSSFLLIRVGVDDMPPMAVVEMRLVLGALAAYAVVAALGIRGTAAALRRPLVALTGLCAAGIPFVLYAWGETRVNSGLAGISNATAPLFGAVIAQMWPLDRGGERLTRRRVAGLLLGFGGVVVLGSDGVRGAVDALGLAAVVGAPLFYGLGASLARQAYRAVDPAVAAVAGNGLSALILLPVALVAGRPDHVPGAGALAAVAVLGVLGTGVAFVLFYRLMARIGSATLTVTYLMPAIAVAEGALFLGETVRWTAVVALLAILAGVAVTNDLVRLPRRRARAAAVPAAELTTPVAE